MKRAIILSSLLALSACMLPPVLQPPPPPPGPAAAIPAGARVFTVYFGWNRSLIGPSGMAVLQQVAAVYRAGGVASVRVTGHTDTSGSAGYNQRLSERRAKNVAAALAGMGIPAQAIAVAGVGENDLAVPTANGVREPHNRRVTVVE
ncbi:MAG TPA: OmpA family protein [Stellaceae bacterium]|nr:OmpA family protein [Stellaceae bacterium]